MVTGTVKWFDVKKGFGFIVNAEGKDVFVHFSSIEGDGFRTLKDGERVEYEQIDSAKGLSARSVKRIKATEGGGGGGEDGDAGAGGAGGNGNGAAH